ncbi:MAG TPA: isocitrate/isopropylmalate family dehydrogenase [Streptosporangiaceae bacterium]
MPARVVVIEADGIGREVIPAAIEVIRRLGLGLEFHPLNVGAERYLKTGEALPEDDFAQIEAADAILLGAIGDPRITDPRYSWQTLGRISRELDLCANVRPARLLCDRLSPLRDPGPRAADIIVVRENTAGLCGRMGGRFKPGTPEEMAIQEHVSTFRDITRILDYAFSTARSSVVLADKWQATPHAGALWQRCWRDARAAHPDLPARHMAIDACARHMISGPWQFDVVVTGNCPGEILSDIAGGLTGGVGLAPSANINATTGRAMFEPAHGSAPGIAGTGTANPAATILAGECTADAGGSLSTREAAAAIAQRLG